MEPCISEYDSQHTIAAGKVVSAVYCLQVSQVLLSGEWSTAQATEVLQLCMGGCAQIDSYMRQILKEALS